MKSSTIKTKIEATSQQTRFDPVASNVQSSFSPSSHNPTRELDIKDINLAINGKALLSDAHLKLLPGVKYLLHGQNGTGKSTVLKAIKERIIPGVPAYITISLLQQRDEDDAEGKPMEDKDGEGDDADTKETSALDLVVKSDEVRTELLRERARKFRFKLTTLIPSTQPVVPTLCSFPLLSIVLQAALEDLNDPQAPSRILRQIKHEKHLHDLELAKKEAELRSGARGSKARKNLKIIEGEVEESLAK